MTPRERYLATLTFGQPDRVPLSPGGGRKSTRERWYSEGLPEDVDYNEYAYRLAGGELEWPRGVGGFGINERMIPQFEEKVIEVRERSQIVQDWKGNICEIGSEFDLSYLRNAIDFVTRNWLKCPVENQDDWEQMKTRYDSDAPERLAPDAGEKAQSILDAGHAIRLHFSGPFWQLREWLGFENLCEAFIEEPDWVHEMVFFWQEHVARLLERALAITQIDHVHFSEDMAYKAHPMIGPEMTREFLLPCYRRWGELLRSHDVPIYGIDSDGDITTLIPVYLEAGVNLVDPMEVAAGIDLPELRNCYGNKLAYGGGVDKREMARGGARLSAEIDRLKPVIDSGGFIPSCDHGVPADVSWPNYCHYVAELARATGWLAPARTMVSV